MFQLVNSSIAGYPISWKSAACSVTWPVKQFYVLEALLWSTASAFSSMKWLSRQATKLDFCIWKPISGRLSSWHLLIDTWTCPQTSSKFRNPLDKLNPKRNSNFLSLRREFFHLQSCLTRRKKTRKFFFLASIHQYFTESFPYEFGNEETLNVYSYRMMQSQKSLKVRKGSSLRFLLRFRTFDW